MFSLYIFGCVHVAATSEACCKPLSLPLTLTMSTETATGAIMGRELFASERLAKSAAIIQKKREKADALKDAVGSWITSPRVLGLLALHAGKRLV